jgi:hypothetical protein
VLLAGAYAVVAEGRGGAALIAPSAGVANLDAPRCSTAAGSKGMAERKGETSTKIPCEICKVRPPCPVACLS